MFQCQRGGGTVQLGQAQPEQARDPRVVGQRPGRHDCSDLPRRIVAEQVQQVAGGVASLAGLTHRCWETHVEGFGRGDARAAVGPRRLVPRLIGEGLGEVCPVAALPVVHDPENRQDVVAPVDAMVPDHDPPMMRRTTLDLHRGHVGLHAVLVGQRDEQVEAVIEA